MANINNHHDKFTKQVLSDKKTAKEFFQLSLPKSILAQVDLDTIEQVKESYVDNELGQGVVDLIYKVKFGMDDGYLIALLEQQSTQDDTMPLRISKYVLRIASEFLDNHKGSKIPLIYPLLLYTGQGKYKKPLSIYDLFVNSQKAKEYLTQPIRLIEVSDFEASDIKEKYYGGLMMYLMNKVKQQDIFESLKEIMNIITKISEEGNIEIIKSMLYYVINVSDSEKAEGIVSEFKKAVTTKHGEEIMTIAERLELKGEQRGIEKGKEVGIQIGREEGKLFEKKQIAMNMLLKKLDQKIIAESTGLTVEEIEKLRTQNIGH
jgi:predicted transposase/invertase (TIGR01784 family)